MGQYIIIHESRGEHTAIFHRNENKQLVPFDNFETAAALCDNLVQDGCMDTFYVYKLNDPDYIT